MHQDPVDFPLHNRDTVADDQQSVAAGRTTFCTCSSSATTGDQGYLNSHADPKPNAAPILHGDYNDDGKVNAADYVVWRDNFGAPNESSRMATAATAVASTSPTTTFGRQTSERTPARAARFHLVPVSRFPNLDDRAVFVGECWGRVHQTHHR